MRKVTLAFANLNDMTWFIMTCRVSDFTADWKNAALTTEMDDSTLRVAFDNYNANLLDIEAVKTNSQFTGIN